MNNDDDDEKSWTFFSSTFLYSDGLNFQSMKFFVSDICVRRGEKSAFIDSWHGRGLMILNNNKMEFSEWSSDI